MSCSSMRWKLTELGRILLINGKAGRALRMMDIRLYMMQGVEQ